MKVAIVGSRTLDLAAVSVPLLNELTRLPQESMVLIRSPRNEPRGDFEELLVRLCKALDIDYDFYLPATGSGRAGVFERDIHMVEHADVVIAYFDPKHIMSGGTGHVVEKAIDAEKPVYAYEVDMTGQRWVGGIEPPEDDARIAEWHSLSPTRR
jgi:hypothetical protein